MSVLVTSYLAYEVDTQITLVKSTESTFPSVTVCNSNPLRKSLISKLTKYVSTPFSDTNILKHKPQFCSATTYCLTNSLVKFSNEIYYWNCRK